MSNITQDTKPWVRELDLLCQGDSLLVKTADGSVYRIRKEVDETAQDPLEDDGRLGTMACWHRRYNLGNEQPKDDPHEWLAEQLRYYTSGKPHYGKPVYDYLLAGKGADCRLTVDGHTLKLEELTNGRSPEFMTTSATEAPAGFETGQLKNVPDWFLNDCCCALTTFGIIEVFKTLNFIFMPLYLMDHSGISISASDFGDRWDSGQVGWIFTSKEKAESLGVEWDEKKIRESMTAEVETYNKFLTGEIYGIIIDKFDPWDADRPEDGGDEDFAEIESCWGFYEAEDMAGFVRDTIGEFEPYEGKPRKRNEPKPMPPIETAPFACVFCGGTVTGRYLGPQKHFHGTCSDCGALYHQ